jgi:ComF family protein
VKDDDQLYQEMHQRLTCSPTSPISNLTSLYHFEKEGTLQSIIHQLKYNGMTSLGVELGRKLGEKLQTQHLERSIDGMIPVPLHSAKLRERGYNQSEHIAKGIRQVMGIPLYSSLLLRHKYTSSQTQLSAVERKENVGDAFSVNKRDLLDLEGKTFLLVDDVITTGATIDACAKVLTQHGARRVVASSVALAE